MIKKYFNKLESPCDPLLGPNLKILNLSLLLKSENRMQQVFSNFLSTLQITFFFAQCLELVQSCRNNFSEALENLSVFFLAFICLSKMLTFVFWQTYWKSLFESISFEEIREIRRQDPISLGIISEYTTYSRRVTYFYGALAEFTNFLMIASPLLIYLTSEEVRNGLLPRPHILSSWFPFDKTKSPGYWIALAIEIPITAQGGLVVAGFDSSAVAVMMFLKGHLKILREKCRRIFKVQDGKLKMKEIMERIEECHRHHSSLMAVRKLFNSLLYHVMFFYLLICSVCICCSVIQFGVKNLEASQKLWIIVYTVALISQLFLYCWHANEVTFECNTVDRGVYESAWWSSDVRVRRSVILLAGKLSEPFVLRAGPFTLLSVATFLEVMKGTYSFYTLMNQMSDH